MERSNKKIILIIMLVGIFLLTGCNKFRFDTFNASDKEETGSEITEAPEMNQKEIEASSKEIEKTSKELVTSTLEAEETFSNESPSITHSVIQPIANINLPVYTVNVDTGNIETVTALIPEGSEISPELIIDTVVESMKDQSIMVGIESIKKEDKTVIVSFFKDKAPLAEVGASYEAAILDAIAQSLIDNLVDYNKVIYRVEGKEYISGHIELGIDEVYLGDN